MNIIKRIRLEICWHRGHRLYLGANPRCATCEDKKTYTLTCDFCGEPFESLDGFPPVQLCSKCSKSKAILTPDKTQGLREQLTEIVLEIRQYLLNTEFAPEPLTKPVDVEVLRKQFPNKIISLLNKWLKKMDARYYTSGEPLRLED